MNYKFYFISCILASLLAGCIPSLLRKGDGFSSRSYVPPNPPVEILQVQKLISIQPEDTEIYLPNPGMGWQDGPAPFGFMHFPEKVSYSNRREIGWTILNPALDSFDWRVLDQQLAQAVRAGKQFSFRVYTYVGEDYGGHMIPEWVLDSGAVLLPSGEPDYSNCAYQEQWGRFVEELRRVYDGNPDIAFIDISGYGNFNEWSWQDHQTEWDTLWEDNYDNGTPTPDSFLSLDGQARRRLADMFIGGSFHGHSCRLGNGDITQVDYSYRGFQKTQLVMPYAGIVQSTQYVFSQKRDVGFRYDCLGRDGGKVYVKVGDMISQIWKKAPIVFELCKPEEVEIEDARYLLQAGHGSIVHNNNWKYSYQQLEDLMLIAGYRFLLQSGDLKIEGRRIEIKLLWQNTGSAPNYPKMGQDFALHFYLVNENGRPVLDRQIPADTSQWFPPDVAGSEALLHPVSASIQLPDYIHAGNYYAGVSILDQRTGKPINLAFTGLDENGIYILAPVTIK